MKLPSMRFTGLPPWALRFAACLAPAVHAAHPAPAAHPQEVVVAASAAASEGNRIYLARYELHGPLRRVDFAQPDPREASDLPTRLLVELGPGESRTLDVPFPAPLFAGPPAVRAQDPSASEGPESASRITPLGTVGPEERDAAWRALSPGLRARGGPPVPSPVGSIRAVDLAWLLAATGLVLGVRRRPWLALALGVFGAAGAVLLRRVLPVAPVPGVTVIELDLASGQALRIDGGAGSVLLPEGIVPLRVTSDPPGAPLGWTVESGPAGGARLGCRVEGTVRARTPVPGPPPGGLAPDASPWRPMAEVWTRSPDGVWAGHGPWPASVPARGDGHGGSTARPSEGLPPVREPGGMPPGWLASGLPPGRGVLIGRLAPAETPARELEVLGPGSTVWIRATGFR